MPRSLSTNNAIWSLRPEIRRNVLNSRTASPKSPVAYAVIPSVSRTTAIRPARLAAASACRCARCGSVSRARDAATRCRATQSAFSFVSGFSSARAPRSRSLGWMSSRMIGSSWRVDDSLPRGVFRGSAIERFSFVPRSSDRRSPDRRSPDPLPPDRLPLDPLPPAPLPPHPPPPHPPPPPPGPPPPGPPPPPTPSHRTAPHSIHSHRIASPSIHSHRIGAHRIRSHRIDSHRIERSPVVLPGGHRNVFLSRYPSVRPNSLTGHADHSPYPDHSRHRPREQQNPQGDDQVVRSAG